MIYGVVSGYSSSGTWAKKPGQDLLIQSLSGFNYLTGNADDDPTPSGLATSDIFTGVHLVQGIIAALINREKTGKGSLIEVSLLESTIDLQFEVITTYLNDGNKLPQRAQKGNAHAYVKAPYGVYKTLDGYISLAIVELFDLCEAMNIELPSKFKPKEACFEYRNEIMEWLSGYLCKEKTSYWMDIFDRHDFACAPVYSYHDLLNHDGYMALKMDQQVETTDGITMRTTRCPIRIDGERIFNRKSAPTPGEDNDKIEKEFGL